MLTLLQTKVSDCVVTFCGKGITTLNSTNVSFILNKEIKNIIEAFAIKSNEFIELFKRQNYVLTKLL